MHFAHTQKIMKKKLIEKSTSDTVLFVFTYNINDRELHLSGHCDVHRLSHFKYVDKHIIIIITIRIIPFGREKNSTHHSHEVMIIIYRWPFYHSNEVNHVTMLQTTRNKPHTPITIV